MNNKFCRIVKNKTLKRKFLIKFRLIKEFITLIYKKKLIYLNYKIQF